MSPDSYGGEHEIQPRRFGVPSKDATSQLSGQYDQSPSGSVVWPTSIR